jgi:hypothetical protein
LRQVLVASVLLPQSLARLFITVAVAAVVEAAKVQEQAVEQMEVRAAADQVQLIMDQF